MDNIDVERVRSACGAFGQFLGYATLATEIGTLDPNVAERIVLAFIEGAKSVMNDNEIAEFILAIDGGITDILADMMEGVEFLAV